MSEPYAALAKIRISRPNLLRWFAAKPRPCTSWTDWERINGRYHYKGEDIPFADYPRIARLKTLGYVDSIYYGQSTYRGALQALLNLPNNSLLPFAQYDDAAQELLFGAMMFSENLADFLHFLSLARGSADFIGDGAGLAVIHGGYWMEGLDQAVSVGPGAMSTILRHYEFSAAAGAFEPIVEKLMKRGEEDWKASAEDATALFKDLA